MVETAAPRTAAGGAEGSRGSSRAVLIAASIYHVIYLLANRAGRRWGKDMLPKVRDVQEAVQTVGYNLGYRSHPPRYAHGTVGRG